MDNFTRFTKIVPTHNRTLYYTLFSALPRTLLGETKHTHEWLFEFRPYAQPWYVDRGYRCSVALPTSRRLFLPVPSPLPDLEDPVDGHLSCLLRQARCRRPSFHNVPGMESSSTETVEGAAPMVSMAVDLLTNKVVG